MAQSKTEQIKSRVSKIEELGDPESSHRAEDELFEDVLRWISNGTYASQLLAREALKVLKQGNTRWYA